jgi:hypothetical protein
VDSRWGLIYRDVAFGQLALFGFECAHFVPDTADCKFDAFYVDSRCGAFTIAMWRLVSSLFSALNVNSWSV